MSDLKEAAREKIARLVERFLEHIDEYKQGAYKEYQARIDYIDPFFKALGWDMDNEQGLAEAYREVIHEDRLKVGRSTTAPDYCFTVYGQRKFFVDAKKPSVDVKADVSPAYQVRRYGWSARLHIAIVTDFEEFSVYECSSKPKPTDKASVSRIAYFTFDQYLKEFDFFWDIFSKEGVLKGRFDKFVQSDTKKKGTATVDEEFLKSIEEWRTYMATTIALRNKTLNEDEINYAVQKLIDRIIFLRICEDRGVEPYGELQRAAEKGEVYQNLCQLFRTADEKYDSSLFNFREDRITPGLIIDNKVLKIIVKDLYYPKCEFEFSVMPADILGSVYERFLGKTIRLTPAHYAKIEDKPEVRKAGGVYYTPKYIVDYIVENTVGKLVENKTPGEAAQLKICDPACGSGSFLIGAYQFLLDWHLKYYLAHPPAKKKDSPLTPDGRLTTAEKKRILLNNIYGVDIDSQAVEVTRLNLLLKAMEGETQASISQQLSMFHERVLPNLDKNIKCGNSLIGTDFYDNQMELFPEQLKKINAFDWETGFPEVFNKKTGMPAEASAKAGFDAVIGNPPYGASLSESEDVYLRKKYHVAKYQLDTYTLFVELASILTSSVGVVGFIIPSAWIASVYDIELRKFLYHNVRLENIVITPKQTFKDATVETLILIYSKLAGFYEKFKVERWDKDDISYFVNLYEVDNMNFSFPIYTNPSISQIIHKIRSVKTALDDFAEVVWGVKVYEKGKGIPPQKGNENKIKVFHSQTKTSQTHRPLIGGKEIFRYGLKWHGTFLNYGKWLAAPRSPDWFDGKRIVVREVTTNGVIQATIIYSDFVFSNSVDGIRLKDNKIELEYLLGIINSKLISFYHLHTSPNAFKGTFPKVLLKDLRELPLPSPPKAVHDQTTHFVKKILSLQEEFSKTNLDIYHQQIKRTIDHTDKQIDQLVYELYGLTEEEIKIVEKGG